QIPEEDLQLVPRRPRVAQGTTEGFPPAPLVLAPPFAMVQADPRLPRAVMFCDSFTQAMFPFLAEHFHRIAFIWQYFPTFDTAVVEREKPQIVIQELVERKLLYPELVAHNLIPVVPNDPGDEPPDHLCRTAGKWAAYLLIHRPEEGVRSGVGR